MRMEPLNLTERAMIQEVQRTIFVLKAGFEKIFGKPPGAEDIVYACKSDECGWWDSKVNSVVAREIVVPKPDGEGGIDPSGYNTAVALCCPECKFRVKAVATHIWLKKCSPKRLAYKAGRPRIFVPGLRDPHTRSVN
jgi:hypothetical protein